jgi:PAS domain S-box-containing protein
LGGDQRAPAGQHEEDIVTSPLRILLLEDDPTDAALTQELLEADNISCEVTRAQTRTEFLSGLEDPAIELILADYKLPSFDGLAALKLAQDKRPDLPFIFVSGTLGEEVAIEALKIGATDYVLKGRLSRLVPSVKRALREAGDRAQRKRAEEALRSETRERLQIWNVSQDLLVVADMTGKYLSVNPAWSATLGWSEADLLGKSSDWLLHPDDREKTRVLIGHLARGRRIERFESRFRHKDGSYRWLSWKSVPDQERIYAVGRDITDLKGAEDRLRETQQELARVSGRATVAAMSAAIAHEIKQPLGAIVMNAAAGLRWLDRAEPDLAEARDSLRCIAEDGQRTGDIIQSIRSMFAKSDQEARLLDTSELIRETIALVGTDLDAAKIAVQLELAERLSLISAHKGQLQQVMLNLITNAADAMRSIENRVRLLRVKSEAAGSTGVAISVQDSGTGIDPKNIDRIFDAFFTTKSNGMGLGLAICRSIVEAHGGALSASPGISQGSIFHIVLPVAPSASLRPSG